MCALKVPLEKFVLIGTVNWFPTFVAADGSVKLSANTAGTYWTQLRATWKNQSQTLDLLFKKLYCHLFPVLPNGLTLKVYRPKFSIRYFISNVTPINNQQPNTAGTYWTQLRATWKHQSQTLDLFFKKLYCHLFPVLPNGLTLKVYRPKFSIRYFISNVTPITNQQPKSILMKSYY